MLDPEPSRVAATAAESPGGMSRLIPATPELPQDKESQRKLAEEMEDGTARKRALDHWKRLRNQPTPEAVAS